MPSAVVLTSPFSVPTSLATLSTTRLVASVES